jgi:sec-independent protein translocase protein TatA
MVWGAITPTALILVLIIVILLFGTSRLRSIGSDLGEALKNFRKSVKDGESKDAESGKESSGSTNKIEQSAAKKEGNVYQGEVVNKDKDKQG